MFVNNEDCIVYRLTQPLAILLILVVTMTVVTRKCFADEPEQKNASGKLNASGEAPLFPDALEDWRKSEPEREQGLLAAEQLRQRLLTRDENGQSGAALIAEAIQDLQASFADRLPDGKPIAGFRVNAPELQQQLQGKSGLKPTAFDAFTGRWYGQWGEMLVNHDWRPTKVYDPPRKPRAAVEAEGNSSAGPKLSAIQFAWISNGFGWNYLASLDDAGKQNVVLGMVYYLEAPSYREITGKTPLVGYADGPRRLVWITETDIFLEEVLRTDAGQQQYVITGFKHDLLGPKQAVTGEGVQAVYTRDPMRRPEFRKFTWTPSD